MKRTDAEGHDNNRYTEGDPAQGIIATVVGAEEMNSLQEEIANVVEDASITLDKNDETQLLQAVKVILGRGGDQIKATLLNNQGTAQNFTGVIFNKANVKSARFLLDVMRRTDTQSVTRVYEVWVIYNTEDDDWELRQTSQGDDDGVSLSVTATGQVQYTSSDLTGANYAGNYRITNIVSVAIGA